MQNRGEGVGRAGATGRSHPCQTWLRDTGIDSDFSGLLRSYRTGLQCRSLSMPIVRLGSEMICKRAADKRVAGRASGLLYRVRLWTSVVFRSEHGDSGKVQA